MKQSSLIEFGNIKSHFILRITSALIIFFITATIQAQSLIPELSFKNPVLKTGKGCMGDGQDGAVYIFENVGWGIDALVTIQGRSSTEVTLSDPDIKGPEEDPKLGLGFEDAWQPGIKYSDGNAPANISWWMEFKISFVKHANADALLAVSQFFVTGLDIDGDGNQLHEFQTYFKPHSFTLERQTAIFASSITGSEMDPLLKGKRFDGPTTDYPGLDYSAQDAMVSNYYTGSNSMVVRLGAVTGKESSVAANRMYGLLFKSLAYDVPVTKPLPVNLVAVSQNKQINSSQ
jgi:hypothetical protein